MSRSIFSPARPQGRRRARSPLHVSIARRLLDGGGGPARGDPARPDAGRAGRRRPGALPRIDLAEHRAASRQPHPRHHRRGPGAAHLLHRRVNGGVWKTTDAGRTWQPIFDGASTGSIGALAVAPSDPRVLYVGTGEAQQRPDLSVGDGVYKSTDAGKTWTHLPHCATRSRLGRSSSIPRTRTGCSSRRSGIPTGPMRSAASSARPTAARRSSACSSRTRTPAAWTSTSIPPTRTPSTPPCGRRARGPGRTGTSVDRAAASSSPSTAARRGGS